jgi:hypothetical protein
LPSIPILRPEALRSHHPEFTLTLTGARLTAPEELLLYEPGVVGTRLAAASPNEVTATLRAAPDCRLGTHAFRLRTRGGASEARVFRVTLFPVVAEKEPNDTPRQAQPVPLNVSVAGIIESGGADCFAVTLKKGQRLAAEVEAVRLGGELTDAVLTVFGPDGRELATVDDTPLFRQDPFLTLLAPADGVYTVQVRETNYGGGGNSRYVLHVGTFLRPAAVFPPGGQAGTEVAVKLLGDAGGERTQTVKLPAPGDDFAFYPSDGTVAAPTPNPFRVSPFPNVNEAEPNDDPRQATPSPQGWPVAFNGVLDRPGDVDHFRFRAARGDVIDVQAFAFRIGSPLDTVVTVLDPSGAVLAANGDDETHDSRGRVTIPADGEYVVRVADKKKGGGPAFLYRIELSRPRAGLTVFLAAPVRKSQDRQTIAVPRGNRVTAYLGVRRDGFDGPVTLTPGELPPGVKATAGTIPAGEYLVPVLFEAAADAPLGGRLVEWHGAGGETQTPVRGGFRQEVNLIPGPGDSSFHTVTLSRLAVVVAEEGPLSVAVVPPAGPFAVDDTRDLAVKVTRAKGFAEPVEVRFPCLPPGVEAPAAVVVPPDRAEAVITLVAHPSAEIGDWPLMVEAKPATAVRGRRDPLLAGARQHPPAAAPGGRGDVGSRVAAVDREGGGGAGEGPLPGGHRRAGQGGKGHLRDRLRRTAARRVHGEARRPPATGDCRNGRTEAGREAGRVPRRRRCHHPARGASVPGLRIGRPGRRAGGRLPGRPRRRPAGPRAGRRENRRVRQSAQPARCAAAERTKRGPEEAVRRLAGLNQPAGRSGWACW